MGSESLPDGLLQCLSEGDHDEPDWGNPATAEGKAARARRNEAPERGVGCLRKSRESGGKGCLREFEVLGNEARCQRWLGNGSPRLNAHVGRNGRQPDVS